MPAALDRPLASGAQGIADQRSWLGVLAAPEHWSLSVSARVPLAFDPASGWLTVWADEGSKAVGEALTPDGFLEVTLGGQRHSSDPASAWFAPALAGAGRDSLAGIRVTGDGRVALELAAQTLARGLTVSAAGPVMVTGAVQTPGPVVIDAATITVRGSLHGGAVDLASPGLVNVAVTGSVAADRVGVTAGVFLDAGRLDADGPHGGLVTVRAGNILQGGRLSADGTAGDGGTVQVGFGGAYVATAVAVTAADGAHGGRVVIDGGSMGRLFSSGAQEARGWAAAGGSVALGGRDVVLVGATADASGRAGVGTVTVNPAASATGTVPRTEAAASGFHLVDPHPTRSGSFGFGVTSLGNGNVVVTDPHDDLVTPDAGAVYLFQGRTGVLLGTLVGRDAGDRLGDTGDAGRSGPEDDGPAENVGQAVVPLTNGNYVVRSPNWNGGLGAVTWGDGSVGVTGTVDATNSLVGSSPGDQVGGGSFGGGVTALTNGNYIVRSPSWNGGSGAATWGDGTAGVTGTIDDTNSLVGSNPGDRVGPGVTALANGNYVVRSPQWNGNRGAVTWGDGTAGVTGAVDASDSLVGSASGDQVGLGVTALSNGNYVVNSTSWNSNRGAVTWGDGTAGVTGAVDASNSLVGSNPGDRVGRDGITSLNNGNYVVDSPMWNGSRGAVTWGDGSAATAGVIDASNSLVGSRPRDFVGQFGITVLSNGNYVVNSPLWNTGRGAVTWGDGSAGASGTINAANSLIGSDVGDQVGNQVTALANGNYVVASPDWNNGRGAATWADGTIGVNGTVDGSNSLVGSNAGDRVSSGGVTTLSNGNYVVGGPDWDGGRGAATWADGTIGVNGTVDDSNSLVG